MARHFGCSVDDWVLQFSNRISEEELASV